MEKKYNHPIAYHLVARATAWHRPFALRPSCQATWRNLTMIFPNAIAAVLMPNHLHLLLWRKDVEENDAVFRLKHLLPGKHWEPLPSPAPIPDPHHLKRQIRYVHLNPCRKKYCGDPLLWEWSTHRDYVGSIAHSWPRGWENLPLIGIGNGPAAVREFHRYVSSDPTTNISGTPLPEQNKEPPAALRIDAVVKAAEIICRTPSGQFMQKGRYRARLMRLLSGPLNVPAATVADYFGVHRTSSRPKETPQQKRIEDRWLKPLLMTLEDPRLLKPKLPPEHTL